MGFEGGGKSRGIWSTNSPSLVLICTAHSPLPINWNPWAFERKYNPRVHDSFALYVSKCWAVAVWCPRAHLKNLCSQKSWVAKEMKRRQTLAGPIHSPRLSGESEWYSVEDRGVQSTSYYIRSMFRVSSCRHLTLNKKHGQQAVPREHCHLCNCLVTVRHLDYF